MNYFTRVWHPDRYQGWHKKRRYFEGWYFKLVHAEAGIAYALIPGISMDAAGDQHAFIQVLNGVKAQSAYHRFPASAFKPSTDRFTVEIGENHFSAESIRIRLPDLRIDADFQGITPWPKRLSAPGVMGWYSYVPGMQCYHGLVSLHHQMSGQLEDANGKHALDGAIGYVEKDWGSSFPNAWVWAQSNHLETEQPASLMISVADIPWLGTSFTGFLATFLFEGELHTFATWTGAKVKFEVGAERVQVTLRDRRRKLIVAGYPAPGGDLASPLSGAMTGKINESLQATLRVQFTLAGSERYNGPAHWAGLEVTDNAAAVLGG